ncbi:PAS domain-containing sensor histidine kinase [Marivirga sp.]|uniref:PAS domain-containing sensor histidine kinase n=1 Tax=Marivirga sp. TaxID=2018662 RepID=UPI002D7F82CB|nr:PAS domain-containing sensor histidine kinase [Marivirga sp.]HET8861159.1 PAS domain-containing sensor histidine kinase [Marivirga sp.]
MKKFTFRNIILGEGARIESEADYRKALLVGVCCLILTVISTVNGLLNVFLWDISLTPSFMVGIFGGVFGFVLNRFGKYELSKHSLLLIAIFFVFIFMSNEGKYYGSQLYLFPILVASITLFGYKKVKIWLFYGFIAFACFVVSEFTTYKIISVDTISEAKEDKIYFLNYLFTFLGLTIVIYFQVKLQYKSEQKILEQERKLKESEERFRLAVEGTNAGIWDWENINKDQQWWSPKLYELLGYNPKEFSPDQHSFKNLLAEKSDYPRLVQDFKRHLQNKEPFSVEYRLKCKDGSYRWFQGSGQAKWSHDEKPVRMVGSLVDITDKKLREEEIKEKNQLLEHTNAELDRFVYSVSHDLRAPLNSIQGLINIGDTTEDSQELKQLLGMMKNRVKKLYTFIDEIISFARNTRTEIVKQDVKLFDLVKETFENTRYRELSAGIDFRMRVDPETVLQTDQSRLGVILNNLVDNAIKYHRHNHPGKYVAVQTEDFGENVVIKVIDNGQGIPLEAQSRIFDMFFRASENSKGSGLGLYIVKDMVERLGGTINLESVKGEGTTFLIKLPKS